MKYTLTDGKEIRIPDKEILHLMNTMHIKAEQAVQITLKMKASCTMRSRKICAKRQKTAALCVQFTTLKR